MLYRLSQRLIVHQLVWILYLHADLTTSPLYKHVSLYAAAVAMVLKAPRSSVLKPRRSGLSLSASISKHPQNTDYQQ